MVYTFCIVDAAGLPDPPVTGRLSFAGTWQRTLDKFEQLNTIWVNEYGTETESREAFRREGARAIGLPGCPCSLENQIAPQDRGDLVVSSRLWAESGEMADK